MKAILLAAGLGTRLSPLTDTVPKCLVPINGTPILELWLEKLFVAGIKRVLINAHYLQDLVTAYLDTSKYREFIELVYEPTLLGTAGTLLNNLSFLNQQDSLFMHGDNYTTANIKDFIEAHKNRPAHCLITMMVFKTIDPSSCGMLEIDAEGVVIGYEEKPRNSSSVWANGAVFILSKEFLGIVQREYRNAHDFSREILPNFIGRIYTHSAGDVFIDVGSPRTYQEACKYAASLVK